MQYEMKWNNFLILYRYVWKYIYLFIYLFYLLPENIYITYLHSKA